jgi:hypothetical protein
MHLHDHGVITCADHPRLLGSGVPTSKDGWDLAARAPLRHVFGRRRDRALGLSALLPLLLQPRLGAIRRQAIGWLTWQHTRWRSLRLGRTSQRLGLRGWASHPWLALLLRWRLGSHGRSTPRCPLRASLALNLRRRRRLSAICRAALDLALPEGGTLQDRSGFTLLRH